MELYLDRLHTVALMHGCRKGENGNIPCPLDSDGYFPLVFGTVARDPSRNDLSSFRYEITEDPGVLVVNLQLFIGAEPTDLSSQERLPFSFGRGLFARSPHVLLLSL